MAPTSSIERSQPCKSSKDDAITMNIQNSELKHPDIIMIENNNQDYLKNRKRDRRDEFLTFDQPIFGQFFSKNFSKELYMEQIHIPRRLNYPARFFESDILEALSKTHWWTPPVFWFPLSTAMYICCPYDSITTFYIFVGGLMLWSLLEYVFHRFIFHCEESIPDNKYFLVLHFFTHAVHHFFPFDHLRLAMPPVMFLVLATFTWLIFNIFLCTSTLLPLFSGIFVGFTLYDLMHYYLHHGAEKSYFSHIRNMRTYHSIHHYKQPNLGYGVTSKFWDKIFGTLLKANKTS